MRLSGYSRFRSPGGCRTGAGDHFHARAPVNECRPSRVCVHCRFALHARVYVKKKPCIGNDCPFRDGCACIARIADDAWFVGRRLFAWATNPAEFNWLQPQQSSAARTGRNLQVRGILPRNPDLADTGHPLALCHMSYFDGRAGQPDIAANGEVLVTEKDSHTCRWVP